MAENPDKKKYVHIANMKSQLLTTISSTDTRIVRIKFHFSTDTKTVRIIFQTKLRIAQLNQFSKSFTACHSQSDTLDIIQRLAWLGTDINPG